MTTTTTRDDTRTGTTSPGSPPIAATVVSPPKLRRRPALVAAGVAAVCLGALLSAWAWSSTTHTTEVLAARTTIHRGDILTAADIVRVRINHDPALHALPASAYPSVIGDRAALDIAAGGLITSDTTSDQALPPRGESVVGISLSAAQAPAMELHGGDDVRVVVTPGQNGDSDSAAPAFTTAEVVDTHMDENTGNTVVDVLVPYADASVLAARAATGNVALVLDSSAAGGKAQAGGR